MEHKESAALDEVDPEIVELAGELRVVLMRLSRRLRTEAGPEALAPGHFAVLAHLRRCGPQTAGALAAHERVQPPSMTKIINGLLEAGHVTRTPCESDRRQAIVALTDEGLAFVDATRAGRDAWLARRLENITPSARDQLLTSVRLLREVADA